MTVGRPVVLVIEDEPQIRRFLHTALDAESFEVIEAATGARGITDAANRRPECIILDLGLPDMKKCSSLNSVGPSTSALSTDVTR